MDRMKRNLTFLSPATQLVSLMLTMALFSPSAMASDLDGDGHIDQKDACPQSHAGVPVDARGCEFDTDRDGVVDKVDECPGTTAGVAVSMRGCAHDSDQDQVTDYRDACPNSAPSDQVDAMGCRLLDQILLPGLRFANGSSTLNRRAKSVLDRAANTLFKYPSLRVEVAGYTDDRGDPDRNRALSQQRADAVRKYLASLGLKSSQLSARGYGELHPIASNSTAAGRAANRRVVLKLKR